MAALDLDLSLPLRDFGLRVAFRAEGTVALVGPSGAGKSSVLRAIAGLARARGRIVCDGEVWLDSKHGVARPPEARRVGLVFQEYALFPHLSVRSNVAYGGRERADELLERFGIAQLASARPGELSGGERQRVALARALARDPQVLLLDEPLSALDAHTKGVVRTELQELLAELEIPVLLVTHDFEDAAALAGSISVIVDGSVRQTGTAAELVARPVDAFVASFTGANVFRGSAEPSENGSTRVNLTDGSSIRVADVVHGDVVVAVYPWDITVGRTAPDDSALNVIAAPVRTISELGNRVRLTVGPVSAEITAESLTRLGLRVGDTAYASFKATGIRVVYGTDSA